jgi:hypothetical protein
MAVNLSPVGGAAAQFFDNNGNPLTGGKLYTYAAGTTTPLATYTTIVGNVAHTNPILLDSAGRVPGGQIWLTNGNTNYKFVLENSANVLVGTYDNIPPAVSGSAAEIVYLPAGTGAVATTVQAKLRESVSVGDFGGNLTTAVNSIGASNVSLLITAPTYITDGSTVTIPSNISLVIQQGGTIQRALGGSLVTTLVLECKTETRYGFFTGLTVNVNGPFLFFGNYDDLDTTMVTFEGSLTPTNDGLTVGNMNIVSGTARPTKLIPNNPAFPATEIVAFDDLDATSAMVWQANHGAMPVPASPLFGVKKYSIYTSNSTGNAIKRIDLDANSTNATFWHPNTSALVLTASTPDLTTFMVGVDYPTPDVVTKTFDPTSCSVFYPSVSGIFRKNGANKDVLVVENLNGVTGDQLNQLFALETEDTGQEATFAQIKVVGLDQNAPYIAQMKLQTRFGTSFYDNISMYRNFTIFNAATNYSAVAVNGSAVGIINTNDTEFDSPHLSLINESLNATSMTVYNGVGGGWNAAGTVMRITKNTATSRSINAAGTVNQSGADYAEYVEKAGDFVIAKGDVCGIDTNGKLTNKFADAISFAVKSTDPGLVGNDKWAQDLVEPTKPEFRAPKYEGQENPGKKPQPPELPPSESVNSNAVAAVMAVYEADFSAWEKNKTQYDADKAAFAEAVKAAEQEFNEGPMTQYIADMDVFKNQLEQRRVKVDRVAFAGQVPVNVIGATPGQYIVPSEDNGLIKGVAISNPTFEQYQVAIGKVIAVEQDGRARIIVKVA